MNAHESRELASSHTRPISLDLDNAPRWLLQSEAADVARVTPRTMRRWISIGLVRASKPAGGRVLVDRDSLRALIEGSV